MANSLQITNGAKKREVLLFLVSVIRYLWTRK